MGQKTDIIRYNVADRGRKFTGQDRDFNIHRLVKVVNDKVTQERVKLGDMQGYLGHDIRRITSLSPPEWYINNGEMIPIEPALKTVHLKALEDGTIEHQAEFLDTPLGKKAQEWYLSGVGGFSSVVGPTEDNPQVFYGFDYVRMPNYHGNRGYVMDDTGRDHFSLPQHMANQKKAALLASYALAQQEEYSAVLDAVVQSTLHQASNTKTQLVEKIKEAQALRATLDSALEQLKGQSAALDSAQRNAGFLQGEVDFLKQQQVVDDSARVTPLRLNQPPKGWTAIHLEDVQKAALDSAQHAGIYRLPAHWFGG